MILENFKDFPKNGAILGIDWGRRRTGLAISDQSQEFVFPRGVLVCPIIDIINKEKPVGVVIGLPLHADGTDSDTTKQVREFADALASQTDLPIIFMEENLTSVAAKEILYQQRATNNNQPIDSAAACVILENALAMIKRLQHV